MCSALDLPALQSAEAFARVPSSPRDRWYNEQTSNLAYMRQDDGMMELVLHDLSELRAAWVDVAARRGVVTRM